MLWAQVSRHTVSMEATTVQGLEKLSSRDRDHHSSLCQVRASSVCSPVGHSGHVLYCGRSPLTCTGNEFKGTE